MGVGRKPSKVKRKLDLAGETAADYATKVLRGETPFSAEREHVEFVMNWVARHRLGTVDARVKAQAPQVQAQQQNLNVEFQAMPYGKALPGEIPV